MASHSQNDKFEKMKKMHFRVDIGLRVNIKLKIGLKTINFIYPENLGLIGLFLSEIEQHEKNAPYPHRDNCT